MLVRPAVRWKNQHVNKNINYKNWLPAVFTSFRSLPFSCLYFFYRRENSLAFFCLFVFCTIALLLPRLAVDRFSLHFASDSIWLWTTRRANSPSREQLFRSLAEDCTCKQSFVEWFCFCLLSMIFLLDRRSLRYCFMRFIQESPLWKVGKRHIFRAELLIPRCFLFFCFFFLLFFS